MQIEKKSFGALPGGDPVWLFTLRNSQGCRARITNYGGIVVSLEMPDRYGKMADLVLGKDRLEDYLAGHPFFGAIAGRVAGRIGGGRFSLDGELFELAQNNGTNCLHGGLEGFDKMLWEPSVGGSEACPCLRLKINDPHGHNNFPGNLACTVTYELLETNALKISYEATTDRATPLNLTNHSYFNLDGHDAGDVLGHEVRILADRVGSVDERSTLLGRLDPVRAGYNDYREPVALSERDRLEVGNADIFFQHAAGRTLDPKQVASVYSPRSGRSLDVLTTEPGVQFYAGLTLSEDGPERGKNGSTYPPLSGFCLETQSYPDSVNYPEAGDAILRPGERFQSTTIFQFGVRD
ncbi:MAG: aldose epimerase family protein [Opitutales bacterium]